MLVTGCSSASPTGSAAPDQSVRPEGSASPEESGPPDEAVCADLDLVGPSGAPVELTGAWRSSDTGMYDIFQHGSCIYWIGMSPDSGAGAGQEWTNVFTGTVGNDFTITGRWGFVPFNPATEPDVLRDGTLEMDIKFDQSGAVEHPVLRAVGGSGGDLYGLVWVREESLSAPTELAGTFGGSEEERCVWVEVDGERIELVGSAGWKFRSPPLSVQDQSGQIVAQVGDPIVVRGQLSAVLGQRCLDTSILVEELDPTP
jgi:hypothetical protein